jgi:hypothetical protein
VLSKSTLVISIIKSSLIRSNLSFSKKIFPEDWKRFSSKRLTFLVAFTTLLIVSMLCSDGSPFPQKIKYLKFIPFDFRYLNLFSSSSTLSSTEGHLVILAVQYGQFLLHLNDDKISRIIKLFNIPVTSNVPMVVTGGSAHLTKLNSVLSEELNIDIIDYSSNTLGAREKSYITLLGAIKYSAIQPTVDQEEQVISTITRVGNRINLKKDDLDDEL